jgi:hypothetical protein
MLLPFSELNSLNLMVIASMLTSIVVSVETYGRLRRGYPIFGKCDDDIIDSHQKRYVRWMWGLGQRNWTAKILKRKNKSNYEASEERIDDNDDYDNDTVIDGDIVEEEINIGIINNRDDEDQSQHIPCTI